MEQSDMNEQSPALSLGENGTASPGGFGAVPATTRLFPQSCPTCGTPAAPTVRRPPYVYAIGRIEPRFPRPSVQKEFAQATARGDTGA